MRRLVAIVVVCGLAVGALAVTALAPGGAPVVQVQRAVTAKVAASSSRRLTCRLRRIRLRTLPALRPTPFCVAVRRGADASADRILVSPRPDPHRNAREQFGLMLISGDGKLLWYMRRPSKVHDLKAVTYGGKPMLAFFEREPHGGYYELLDQQYRPVRRLRTGRGRPTDEHELQLTPAGTAYLGADPVVRKRGAGDVSDYVVQEVDVATGKVLFEWRALDRIPFSYSWEGRPPGGEPWDYFHGNAIDPPTAEDPTVMISSRDTSALYGVDRATGRTKWILGGKHDQFHLARHPGWVFCTQHDAHRLPGGRLLLFDNGGAHTDGPPDCPLHPARALLFKLDVAHRRVRLLRSISSRDFSKTGRGFLSQYVGSARLESDGDTLIDWGDIPRISSVGPDGRENRLLRLRYWSYRAAPTAWVGRPAGAPKVVARRGSGHVSVWVSWNGATEIARWQVLAGRDAASLAPVGDPVPFQDLETQLSVRTSEPWLAVQALDASGTVIGTSRAIKPG